MTSSPVTTATAIPGIVEIKGKKYSLSTKPFFSNQWNLLGCVVMAGALTCGIIGTVMSARASKRIGHSNNSEPDSDSLFQRKMGRILFGFGVFLAIVASVLFYQPLIEYFPVDTPPPPTNDVVGGNANVTTPNLVMANRIPASQPSDIHVVKNDHIDDLADNDSVDGDSVCDRDSGDDNIDG